MYAANEDDPTFFPNCFIHLHDFHCNKVIIVGDFILIQDIEKVKKGGRTRMR